MSAVDDVMTHDELAGELRSAVAARELSYCDPLPELARKLADLAEHDSRTMTAGEFQSWYGGLEQDIRRAVRKWARENY